MYVNKWSYSSDPIKLINGTSKTIVVSVLFSGAYPSPGLAKREFQWHQYTKMVADKKIHFPKWFDPTPYVNLNIK
jgi:hypothetical protein